MNLNYQKYLNKKKKSNRNYWYNTNLTKQSDSEKNFEEI